MIAKPSKTKICCFSFIEANVSFNLERNHSLFGGNGRKFE